MEYPANESNKDSPNSSAMNGELLTKFERVTRALRTLSAGNHTLLHTSDEQELLQDMCQVIVEKGGYRTAGVAYVEHNEDKSIRWMVGLK